MVDDFDIGLIAVAKARPAEASVYIAGTAS